MLEQSSTVQHLLRRGRMEGREEGREEGHEQGLEEGIALGLLSGERKQFMQTAQLFFGPVPSSASLLVNTAQEAQISLWTSRLRTATSWDELLRDEPGTHE